MKLCETGEPSTRSTEPKIAQDPWLNFDFLRIITLSVMACAARRVKFYTKAMEALTEAKDICLQEGEQNHVHPLMTALTLLNLSAVLGDIDHDEHGLRWGLEALSMMYDIFRSMNVSEVVQAYYLALPCHNAALLNMKLQKWADASELVGEGIEFTKLLKDGQDDGLRGKLIAIGAQAKHVPEGFLQEAVNALNGWGEERGIWNLSFWDFSVNEILEEIRVLKETSTLKHLIIDNMEESRISKAVEDSHLLRFILAVVSCQSLELFTISGIDFDPRKVWRRIKKRSFLETSWYAATSMNYAAIRNDSIKPPLGEYKELVKQVQSPLAKKLVLFLLILGNECEGVDLSSNGLDSRCVTALVHALRSPDRPTFASPVSTVILRANELDAHAAGELAKTWTADGLGMPIAALQTELREPTVTSLDVSENSLIGDKGFHMLVSGIIQFPPFRVLKADGIGLRAPGCNVVEKLSSTCIEILNVSDNDIGSEGAEIISRAVMHLSGLRQLALANCNIGPAGATVLADTLSRHPQLTEVLMSKNQLGSEGAITLCNGAAQARALASMDISCNGIESENAARSIGELMRRCDTLREINLSGNKLDPKGLPHIGSAIEHSKVLKMYLEDMGLSDLSIDDFLDHGAAETQDLQVMILNKNPVGDKGLGIIAECLSIGLTDLCLSNCELTKSSQATLLNLVSLSPNLRSLDLSYNDLGAHGCSHMVVWMTQNEREQFSLRSLELAHCNLGDEGLLRLVPVLGALTYVGVRGNNITSAGLEAVMNSNQMIQLKTMNLADNQIGELGVHALTERFQQEHKRSLWNAKQLTSTIDTVILTNNQISNALAKSTECFLKIHNPLLTVVW